MSFIILPQRWTVQPQYPVAIDRNNQLGNALYSAWAVSQFPFSWVYDAAGRVYGSIKSSSTGVAQGINRAGAAYSFTARGISSYTESFSLGTSPLAGNTAGAVAVLYTVSNATDARALLGDQNSSDSNASIELFGFNAGQIWARSYIGGSQRTISGGSVVAGPLYHAVATYDGATFKLYLDGREVATTSASGTMGNSLTQLGLGARGEASGQYGHAGTISNVQFFTRGLTPGEVRELYNNPWQVYRPIQTRLYFGTSGASSPQTITTSLSAAIQAALQATATLSAGIQVSDTRTATLDSALEFAVAATSTLQAAIQAAISANATLDGYVQAGSELSSTLDAGIQDAKTGATSLNAAIEASQSATATLAAAIEVAQAAIATLDAAIAASALASSTLDAFIQAGTQLVATVDAAVQFAATASATLSAAIAELRTGSSTLDAVLVTLGSVAATLDAAILSTRAATATLNAYIEDATAVEPRGSRYRVGRRPGYVVRG